MNYLDFKLHLLFSSVCVQVYVRASQICGFQNPRAVLQNPV